MFHSYLLVWDAGIVEEDSFYLRQLGSALRRSCQRKSADHGAEAGTDGKIPAPPTMAGSWLGMQKCLEALRDRVFV